MRIAIDHEGLDSRALAGILRDIADSIEPGFPKGHDLLVLDKNGRSVGICTLVAFPHHAIDRYEDDLNEKARCN